MTRAVHSLVSTACALALACSHEASAPSAVRDAPVAAPLEAPPQAAARDVEPAVARSGAPCVDVDGELGGKHITLDGHVFVDRLHEHPARGKTHPFILRLDEPRCAIGTDDPQINELHLTSIEAIPLQALAGRHVRVSGDPFAAHTAWHARPVVLMTTKATALP